MAPRAHNEIEVQIGDEVFTLSYTFTAMRRLERLIKKPIGEIFGLGEEEGSARIPISAEFIACALAAGLEKHHPKLRDTAKVTRLLERVDPRETFGSIQIAVVKGIMIFFGQDPDELEIEDSGGKKAVEPPKSEAPVKIEALPSQSSDAGGPSPSRDGK